jgi:hypothetical protein
MPKIVVEGPDGRKFAFPDTMPRAEINAFMKQKYGTKAPNESVQDYLARFGREQAATEARVKDIDREATVVGRAEGERAAERMGVDNPLMMAFAAPAIGLAQQEGGRRVFDREGTVLADEAAGLSAANAAAFFVPGMVNKQFGARVEEGRRQQPLAAFAGDVAGGFGPGEIIGAGVSKAVQAIGPGMAALGRMLSRGPGPDTTNAIVGGTLGGIAPAETAEERARNVAVGAGLGYVARPASQAVDRVSDRVLGSGNPNLKGVDKKRQAYTFDVGGAKAKVTFEESFPDDGDYPRRVPTDIARLREDVRQEYLTPLQALDRSVEAIVPDRYNRAALGPTGPTRTLQDSVNVEMDISNANLTLPQAKQLFEKTFDTFEDHAIRHRRPVYYFTGAKPSQQTLYENTIKRRGAPKGYVATTGPDGFYFVRDDLFQNFAKELQDDGYDVITRTASNPRATAEAVPAGGYFGRQSMRPPGSGPSAREIETQQQWATATPIVTQARTTAQSAAQAADAALQSKAPADIARAKDQKKALVGQLQEAQASRAGMDTPEDARLAETLASLTENTSDPVLLSTQISAAKTSLDRLLTDIGSPVEGNLIPVKTNILTRTQAPRSAAEGPQDRASVTRYAEGGDDVQPMGFGASTPKTPQQAARFETPGSPESLQRIIDGEVQPTAEEMRGIVKEIQDAEFEDLVKAFYGDEKKARAFQYLGRKKYLTQAEEEQFARLREQSNPDHVDAEIADVTDAIALRNAIEDIEGGRYEDVLADAFRRFPLANEPAERIARGSPPYTSEEKLYASIARRAIAEAKLQGRDPTEVFNNALGSYGSRFSGDDKAFMRKSITDLMNMGNLNKSTSSTLLAAAPFAAVGGAGLTSERELGSKMKDDTIRADGTKKGTGFLGPLKRPDGMTMTEYSVGVNIDGKDVEIPTLVPTLTQDEIDLLLNLPDGDKPPRAIINKAIDHARNRIKNNKSPFWNPQDDGQSTPKKKD